MKTALPSFHILPVAAGLLLVGIASGSAQQALPPPGQVRPAQIDRNGVLILVRSTLLAVHQANVTGNYTVLRDLGAPSFQAANTAAHLAEIFAGLRNQNLDLSGVAVLDPQLTVLPEVNASGLMHMAGFFPSVPLQVYFDLIFAPASGRWQSLGISINVAAAASAAPVARAPPAPAKKPTPTAPPARDAHPSGVPSPEPQK